MERMPVLDEIAYAAKRSDEVTIGISTSNGKAESISASTTVKPITNGHSKTFTTPTNALMDLLDLSVEDVPAPSQSPGDFLQDLLGVTSVPSPSNATTGNILSETHQGSITKETYA